MSCNPDIGVWISFRNVVVQVLGSPVVMALFVERLAHTGRIAAVARTSLAVTHLLPRPVTALSATARAK